VLTRWRTKQYAAEDFAQFWLGDHDIDLQCMHSYEELLPFVVAAACSIGIRPARELTSLRFAFDIADDEDAAGWMDVENRTMHLWPQSAHQWTVLHELTHYIHPCDAHGPRVATTFAMLVGSVLGDGPRADLEEAYADHGVMTLEDAPVMPWWEIPGLAAA